MKKADQTPGTTGRRSVWLLTPSAIVLGTACTLGTAYAQEPVTQVSRVVSSITPSVSLIASETPATAEPTPTPSKTAGPVFKAEKFTVYLIQETTLTLAGYEPGESVTFVIENSEGEAVNLVAPGEDELQELTAEADEAGEVQFTFTLAGLEPGIYTAKAVTDGSEVSAENDLKEMPEDAEPTPEPTDPVEPTPEPTPEPTDPVEPTPEPTPEPAEPTEPEPAPAPEPEPVPTNPPTTQEPTPAPVQPRRVEITAPAPQPEESQTSNQVQALQEPTDLAATLPQNITESRESALALDGFSAPQRPAAGQPQQTQVVTPREFTQNLEATSVPEKPEATTAPSDSREFQEPTASASAEADSQQQTASESESTLGKLIGWLVALAAALVGIIAFILWRRSKEQ